MSSASFWKSVRVPAPGRERAATGGDGQGSCESLEDWAVSNPEGKRGNPRGEGRVLFPSCLR